MCGINLFIDKNGGRIDPSLVAAANAKIRHRGPDDEQSYFWENVGLGFVRLSIVDLAGGQQPFISEDNSKALICNGEIYNYRELREKLVSQGHRFKTKSDCEVVLHLYEEEPETFVRRLKGMFAFVLLDQTRREVLLARDRLGIKPLFYHNDSATFSCSSEIRGILPALGTKPRLAREAIKEAFTFGYIPGEKTAYDGVFHVPPAEILKFSLTSNTLSGEEYWRPAFVPVGEKQKTGMRANAAKLNALIGAAVGSHTIGDVPMSSYLSGGLDSTIVSGLLRREYQPAEDLCAFSIKFAEQAFDESAVFEETKKVFGLAGQVVTVAQTTADDFIAAVRVIEQPQLSPLDVPMQRLSQLVRQHERKVVLVGEGSDELFGGYISFVMAQARRALFLPAIEPLRPLLLDKVVGYFLGKGEFAQLVTAVYQNETEQVLAKFGVFPPWYPWWSIGQNLRQGLFAEQDYDPLGARSGLMKIVEKIKERSAGLNEYDKGLYLELKTRLPNYILSRADRNSMHHSVELRLPFLDNDVIDFSLTIPEVQKMFALKEKYILRQAFQKLVPRHVAKRRKFGYDSPTKWLWAHPTEQAQDLMSAEALKRTGIFDPAAIEKNLQLLKDQSVSPHALAHQEALVQLTGALSVQALAYQ